MAEGWWGLTPASADTIASKRAEAAALARQIDAQGREIEVLAEQYNGARMRSDQAANDVASAGDQLSRAQADVIKARAALAEEAVAAYTHGGYVSLPQRSLYSGHADLAIEQHYFRIATNSQADRLDGMRAAERRLKDQRAAFDAAKHSFGQAGAALASRRQAVEQAVATSQETLNRVNGELAQLVAQQQAQLEAQQQARARAELAARLAQAARQAELQAAQVAATRSRQVAAVVPVVNHPASQPAPPAAPPLPTSSGAAAAVAFARSQLGKPYQWGAAGPDSYDCSGLTMRAWQAGGKSLPHYAAGQYSDTAHVPISQLQPGDLVFFGSDLHHVGIYVGGGNMIDAPHSGAVVRYDAIYWPDLQPYGGRPS
jgi:cell wall-associated NlpC family hydrolase